VQPPGARFCPECGRAVAAAPIPDGYTPAHIREQILAVRSAVEGERKQVSVLFCDIVRSSALAAELGPEEFHLVIDRFFGVALAEVHRYEGTVNQFLGDGFMALFGAPVAHEDHARHAVLAALGIAARAEVPVRIGINSGLVVVGTIGDDLRVDYTAFGDTTVLAARLQSAAAPGAVLVSQHTADLVRGYFQLEEVAPVQVKERTVRLAESWSPRFVYRPGSARISPAARVRSAGLPKSVSSGLPEMRERAEMTFPHFVTGVHLTSRSGCRR
jgi:class 3 adenylate cyclase